MNRQAAALLTVGGLVLLSASAVLLATSTHLPLQAQVITTTNGNFFSTTTTGGEVTQYVSSVQGLRARPGTCNSGMILLSWKAPDMKSGFTITYAVYRTNLNTPVYEGGERSFSDTGLPLNEEFTYFVVAQSGTYGATPVSVTVDGPVACETTSPAPSGDGNHDATTTSSGGDSGGSNSASTTTSGSWTVVNGDHVTSTSSTSGNTPSPSNPKTGGIVGTPVVATPVISTPVVTPLPTPAPNPPVSIVRDLPIATTSTAVAPPTPDIKAKVVVLSNTIASFSAAQASVSTAQQDLIALVTTKIDEKAKAPGADKAALTALQDSLTKHITDTLSNPSTVSNADITKLTDTVGAQLQTVGGGGTDVSGALSTIATKAAVAPTPDVTLLYADSNHDGISDYDAIHVFNMDPKKPAPVTVVGSKTYTAEAKALAGYDPSKKELVRVFPEEPSHSTIPPTKAYTIDTVALASSTQELDFSGKALPNSFITLYIFSTPVVVTLKTSADGTWHYTLDRELNNGLHTIQTATVDNSGHILAKSNPVPFTKTAQAATLDGGTSGLLPANDHPSFLGGTTLYMLLLLIAGTAFLTVGIIGLNARRKTVADAAPAQESGV